MKPGVSVIVPTYNREKYLAECLQSIIDQKTDFPVEIVCADDGSNDRSKTIALSFGDSVRWLDKPKGCQDQGCGTTRNRAIVVAKYPYLAFLDSDDVFLPGHLQRCYDFLQSHPEEHIVIDQLYFFDSSINQKWIAHYPDGGEVQHRSYLRSIYYQFDVVMLRKELFDKVGGMFDPKDILSEDYDFFLRVFENGFRIPILEGAGACLREHEGRSVRAKRNAIQSSERTMHKAIKRWPYSISWIRKRKAVIEYHYSLCDFSDKKYISALRRLVYTVLLDPVRVAKTALKNTLHFIKRMLPAVDPKSASNTDDISVIVHLDDRE